MREEASFEDIQKYLERESFPVWAAYPDDIGQQEDVLTIDWCCRHRIPDGKYFCTWSRVTQEQVNEFKLKALEIWEKEKLDFANSLKD